MTPKCINYVWSTTPFKWNTGVIQSNEHLTMDVAEEWLRLWGRTDRQIASY